MNYTTQRTMQPDQPMDALLTSFFRAEMPDPWPALKLPARKVTPPPSWFGRSRSRLALAASIALLAIASWWLAGRAPEFTPEMTNTTPGVGSANPGHHGVVGKVKGDEDKARATNPTDR